MTITYRTPSAADIPALAALGAETFMDTFGHLYSTADSGDFIQRVHSIQGVTADMQQLETAYHVAENESGLIAYCKIGKLGLPVTPSGAALELKQLYVREKYTGTGVAHHLMAWALTTCRARFIEEIYLSVYQDNPRALTFYQKFGFAQFAEYKFMVGTQADPEFIYKLTLTQ
jgi:diamine N-acetyltransferase